MREQLLAANNLLIGTTNILLVGVPDTWRVARGHSGPEVERWSEYRTRRWMTLGQGPYRLVDPHPEQPALVRAEVELFITARPGEDATVAKHRLTTTGESGVMDLAGHEAHYTYGTVKRGFLRSSEVPALHLAWTCAETSRHLTVEYSASFQNGNVMATTDDLSQLLQALTQAIRCH